MTKNEYKVGQIVKGSVTGIEKYGVFVNLNDSYSGLIHISEISNSFVRNINDYVSIGENIKAKVMDIDMHNCQVKLSIKDVDYRSTNKRKNKIKETQNGFSTLEYQLKKWIESKEKVILSKKN